ncbi:MAG: nitroreductase [Cyclobacteriaceae bacterium]
MTIEELHQLIRGRRSVYPPQYLDKVIPDQLIKNMLENANWAPTHRLTQPWRFKVIKGAARKKFGTFMAEKYRSMTNIAQFSIVKYEKFKTNPQKAGAIIAICMQRDPKERVPEWEEVAATAMAVQNIWLTASAYGIGAYWSSPGMIQHFSEFSPLESGESCIGLFYMGYYQPVNAKPPRTPIEDKVEWIQ